MIRLEDVLDAEDRVAVWEGMFRELEERLEEAERERDEPKP